VSKKGFERNRYNQLVTFGLLPLLPVWYTHTVLRVVRDEKLDNENEGSKNPGPCYVIKHPYQS
jgi:hypothetical protein